MRVSKTTLTLLAAVFIPTVLIGTELMGQGIDVVMAYKKIPNTIWRPVEAIGFIFATLTINNFYLGVYSCSFLLTGSIAYFFKREIYKKYFIYLFYIIGISFSWPLLLAANNALRQGVAISLSILFIGISKNIQKYGLKILLFLLILPFLLLSHRYGQLSLFFIFWAVVFPWKYKSSLVPLFISLVITIPLIIIFGESITKYGGGYVGVKAQYFLIPILSIFNLVYFYFFRKIDLYQRIAFTLSNSFLLLSIASYSNTSISERLLQFPVVNMFLNLPSLYQFFRPKWLFALLSISIIFFYMCMSLYFVGFKFYD